MIDTFLFPGQGSQYVGMGRDLFGAHAEARARFEQADDLLGFSLTGHMFGGSGSSEEDEDALRQTEITQPALYVHSMAAMAVLEARGLLPVRAAGHSLGEYSALAATEAISFEDGLRIVRLRGERMAEAGTLRPGGMAAILGVEDDVVEKLCEASSDASGIVQPANFNAPGQVVISGDVAAVQRAVELAPAYGARRAVSLQVSGAFHSPLMEHARAGLAEVLVDLPIRPPGCPVYLNVTARPTTDPEEIRARLLDQLTAPVRWSQTLMQMQTDGASHFTEVGAGNVLTGLARRTLGRNTETAVAGKAEDLLALVSTHAS